jgi:perosamine synthetase
MFFKILYKLSDLFDIAMQRDYYGFIQGHSYIKKKTINKIKKNNSKLIVQKYEKKFSSLIGSGDAVSFASARMSFFAVMKAIGVKEKDEVILNGSTCAVMVNAVLRIGAVPVFSDICSKSFGSCPNSIKKVLTPKSKLIVAQHSFGIPCEINKIKELAKSKNIFLLEDCALSVGSKFMNKNVGTFSNASIFSTDRSKPINSILGGLVYTKNKKLYKNLKVIQNQSKSLSKNKQDLIWDEFLLERKYLNPLGNKKYNLINSFSSFKRRFFAKKESAFLNEDSGIHISMSYPYPAKLPNFVAEIGMLAIDNWKHELKTKQKNLKKYLKFLKKKGYNHYISKAYYDKKLKIIPSRFVFSIPDGQKLRKKLKKYIDTTWTWFLHPIVDTSEPLYKFGYKSGCCPISEKIGKGMINLPTNLSEKKTEDLLNKINKLFNYSI